MQTAKTAETADPLHTDVSQLLHEALQAQKNAHAPYSRFGVGAALLSDNGKIYRGVNVENCSYGLSLCAERNAIFSAVTEGMKFFVAIAVVADCPDPVRPCGACRQIISEFGRKDSVIILGNLKGDTARYTIAELLPLAFSL